MYGTEFERQQLQNRITQFKSPVRQQQNPPSSCLVDIAWRRLSRELVAPSYSVPFPVPVSWDLFLTHLRYFFQRRQRYPFGHFYSEAIRPVVIGSAWG